MPSPIPDTSVANTEEITNLGVTATEHDTEGYADTVTSGDQTSVAEQQREAANAREQGYG